MIKKAKKGKWVEICQTVLEPNQRAPQVPDDTKKVPLEMRVKGFIVSDAIVGETVTIRTVTDREVTGKLIAVNPGYEHDFGKPIPELLTVGEELRQILK